MNINDMKIAVIDIETTGFFRDGGFIVEVGIVSLNTATGEVEELMSTVCREEGMKSKDRDAWIFKNSDLTVDEVRESCDFTEIKQKIQDIINSVDACTAYNKSFDFSFLRDRGVEIPNEVTCPMLAATDVCKLDGRMGSYKWPSVEEAWKHFFPEQEYVELHRGLDDAKHEALIVQELIGLERIKVE